MQLAIKFFCLSCLGCILVFLTAHSALADQDSLSFKSVRVGSSYVTFSKKDYGRSRQTFVVLHDNEQTGFEAATRYCGEHGGRIIKIDNNCERFVSTSIRGTTFTFDPNQMFSRAGLSVSARKYSPLQKAALLVDSAVHLGKELLNFCELDSLPYLITLHNNTEGNFSIKDYRKGGILAGIAKEVYFQPSTDPDDFILVTEKFFYDYLKQEHVNVILQDSLGPHDGSLSVYAQLNNIPYINIEVQHGHQEVHYRYINIVRKMLVQSGLISLF